MAGSKTWLATLSKDGVTVIPSTDCPDARVLRRKTILNLIEAQPRQRFEALRAFITVPNVEKSENALRETVKATEDSFNEAVRSLTHAEDELEKLWTTESKPGTSAIDWATTEAQKDLSELRGNVDKVARLEPAFHSVETALNALTRALAERKTAAESLAAAQTKQNVAGSSQMQQNAQLLGLLQDAQSYVTQNRTLSRCPICEQGIDSSELVKRVGERIAAMRELAELVSATGTARRQLDTKVSVSDHARTEFYQRATIFAGVLKSSLLNDIKAFALEWINFCELLSEETLSETVEQEARRLWSVASQCRQSLQARREIDQKSLNQHNAIKGHVDTLKKRKVQAGSDETLLKKLKAALNLVSQQRKSYVDGILRSIAIEVERLYTRLHPGEGIGKIRLFLKPSAIGSLEFDAQFQNVSDLPPQAYYSESHLITLGICVFLALAKYFKTANTIVVLDDVLTSVDAAHLARFMALLHDEASHFSQVIVTTHYRPWRDRYRWAKGPTANTQVIELGPWTLQNGLQAGQFFTAVQELHVIVGQAQFDRQVAASKAGIVLESLLDFITLKYRCAIPSGSYWQCRCGELELYPLIYPGADPSTVDDET